MSIRLTILGCGNSAGVPAIGNHWGVCDPDEPKNQRLRSSVLVQAGNTNVIVDTGPDFRTQINKTDVKIVHGALFSHEHGDHTHGIDDLRRFRYQIDGLVPVFGDLVTITTLKQRFGYMFEGGESDLYPAILRPTIFKKENYGRKHSLGDVTFIPFAQDHGTCVSVGYRFGSIAYSPDMRMLDNKAVEILKGIEVWIADATGYKNKENKVHAHLNAIYEMNKRIGAREVYLTGLSPAMDYNTLRGELPEGYAPAYDMLSFVL